MSIYQVCTGNAPNYCLILKHQTETEHHPTGVLCLATFQMYTSLTLSSILALFGLLTAEKNILVPWACWMCKRQLSTISLWKGTVQSARVS